MMFTILTRAEKGAPPSHSFKLKARTLREATRTALLRIDNHQAFRVLQGGFGLDSGWLLKFSVYSSPWERTKTQQQQ